MGDGTYSTLSVGLTSADLPQPATLASPGVADASVVGVASPYARMDHTHASKARKTISAVSASTYTWTYPTAFGAGVVPICNAIAQVASGTTDLVNVQVQGTPTNTQCTFQITRYSQGLVGLVTGVLSVNSTPFSGSLHCIAFEP